jgi:peptidoglycan/LPS O-acetylase OafA/YrhL
LAEVAIGPAAAAAVPNPAEAKSTLRYMPGLDVMRGVAILMVMLYHGLHVPGPLSILLYGAYGVHLFFVLSGFLITGILIDTRNDRDYYRNFYLRRALRIIPAYLLMIAVLKIAGVIDWRFVLVCLLYFCNMSAILRTTPQYGPFWSLSVEEQFYLVWPLVVRNISRRALYVLSVAIIVLTPVLRFGLLFGPGALGDIVFKTWAVADFFAAGALLAIAIRRPLPLARLGKWIAPLVGAGLALLIVAETRPEASNPLLRKVQLALVLEPWLLLFSGLILFALLRPAIAKMAIARPLVFLANISYGLYLCHQLIFLAIDRHWVLQPGMTGFYPLLAARFLVEAGVSIAVATLSRRTFEEFFLRMKPKHHPARPR